jgi:hypothetical protein
MSLMEIRPNEGMSLPIDISIEDAKNRLDMSSGFEYPKDPERNNLGYYVSTSPEDNKQTGHLPSYTSKNEWKRHVSCRPLNGLCHYKNILEAEEPGDKSILFNRSDIYRQHLADKPMPSTIQGPPARGTRILYGVSTVIAATGAGVMNRFSQHHIHGDLTQVSSSSLRVSEAFILPLPRTDVQNRLPPLRIRYLLSGLILQLPYS